MEFSANKSHLNSKTLLISILKTIHSGWTPPSHFELMARELGIPDGASLIFFLTGVMQIIREIPTKVFNDTTVRSALLESIQTALDSAIEREEIRIFDENNTGK